jgi:hypothetical protein
MYLRSNLVASSRAKSRSRTVNYELILIILPDSCVKWQSGEPIDPNADLNQVLEMFSDVHLCEFSP